MQNKIEKVYIVKPNMDEEQFLREFFGILKDNEVAAEVFNSKFTKVEKEYFDVVCCRSVVELDYELEVGRTIQEQYTIPGDTTYRTRELTIFDRYKNIEKADVMLLTINNPSDDKVYASMKYSVDLFEEKINFNNIVIEETIPGDSVAVHVDLFDEMHKEITNRALDYAYTKGELSFSGSKTGKLFKNNANILKSEFVIYRFTKYLINFEFENKEYFGNKISGADFVMNLSCPEKPASNESVFTVALNSGDKYEKIQKICIGCIIGSFVLGAIGVIILSIIAALVAIASIIILVLVTLKKKEVFKQTKEEATKNLELEKEEREKAYRTALEREIAKLRK